MNVLSPWAVLTVTAAALLTLSGCGKQNVYNDNYEQPTQPDLALRQLMGVRTLRTSFEMPEDMRTFRTGLIFIENDMVVGSNAWTTGDNVHTYHSDGKKEYAKTLHVEYMNWKDGDEWKSYFRVSPSFLTLNSKIQSDFWEQFETGDFRTKGHKNDFHDARFGDFQVIGAWYGSRENAAIGSLQTILGGMDSIALLVVDFSAEEQDPHGAPLETPSNEELQKILDNLNYR